MRLEAGKSGLEDNGEQVGSKQELELCSRATCTSLATWDGLGAPVLLPELFAVFSYCL